MEDPSRTPTPTPTPTLSPFPDLNLLPFPLVSPKIEPKLEPSDDHPSATTQQTPFPNTTCHLVPELHAPLQQLSPDRDDETLFAEYFRLARLFLSSYARKLRSPTATTTTPPNNNVALAEPGDNSSNSAIVVAKKRKPRSAEMVRVSALAPPDHLCFRHLVRRTRITFDSLRALLIRDDERSGLYAKRGRADLKAAALMTDRDLWLNRDKRIVGPIPGLAVGDIFFFRMELCIVGLHGQVQAGIDYVPASRSPGGEPVATSIIVSGGYEDDDDAGDVLVYTGHGGRDRNAHRHCVSQKLEGGNLALERSLNYGIEIRVIRGIKSDRSPSGRIYVYDGIYKIIHYWLDIGKSGFGVYKYKLVRVEGQDDMGSAILKFAGDLQGNPLSLRPTGYLSLDISMGKESFPISLFNDIDDSRDPLLFEYVARPLYPLPVLEAKAHHLDGGGGCGCMSNCSVDCCCAKRNGGEFAYDGSGILVRGKPLIYECGASCRCPQSCPNRVTQKGVMHPLEIFRSRVTGWGVRSLDLIRAGTFICEFSGIVLTKQQSELLSMSGDSFVRPNRFPARWLEWGDISDVFPDYMPPNFPSLPELSFSIDVSRARNVACYLSHSCSPNVFLQFVLFDHYNVSYPHLMIFAMENIPPLRELSIDYGVVDEWVGKLTL